MFIIDLTNPLTLVLLLIATVLLIFLGNEEFLKMCSLYGK